MSQPTGYPGGGIRYTKNFVELSGTGDPNTSSTPDVQRAKLNYAYWRDDAPDSSRWLYQCTTAAIIQNGVLISAALWTAK